MKKHYILRSPDPVDGGPVSTSFLEDDLSGVDTSMPLVSEGLYEFSVAEIKEEPSKSGDKTNLRITLKLVREAQDTKGNVVNAGFPLFATISLSPTEKYSKDDIKKKVAGFVQAAGGSRLYPLEQYLGKVVWAKIKVRKEREDQKTGETYPESNEVKMFVKPDDAQ